MDKPLIAWSIYLVGAVLLGAFGWRITRSLSRYARHFLLVSYFALVLTPYSLNLEDKPDAYAPALFIAVLNSFFQGMEQALDPAVTLALVWIGALMASLAYLIWSGRRRARSQSREDAA